MREKPKLLFDENIGIRVAEHLSCLATMRGGQGDGAACPPRRRSVGEGKRGGKMTSEKIFVLYYIDG